VIDSPNEVEILQGRVTAWKCRQALLNAAREWLTANGFLEVETPVCVATPALEDYIEAERAGKGYLRTSPELHMKRLLGAGCERIFQVGPCFRRGEQGRWHLPEFTMLEWYRLRADHRDILRDTIALVRHSLRVVMGSDIRCSIRNCDVDFGTEWEELTVDDAFRRYTGKTVEEALAADDFERLLVEQIEPNLGVGRPTVLSGYPLVCSGLSKPMPGHPDRAERWELYAAGLELANACSELTDADEQRRRFLACAELRRTQGRPVYEADESFLACLSRGLPPAAGIAVGIDRLVAVAVGAGSISEVTTFAGLS